MRGWDEVNREVDACRTCEATAVPWLHVPVGGKPRPSVPPPRPTRLLFVAVAPPFGGGHFWDAARADRLRDGLLRAVCEGTGEPVATLEAFLARGFYLVPAVRCPSGCEGRDHPPARGAIDNCRRHLAGAVEVIRPERVVTLGRVPFASISGLFELGPAGRLADESGRIRRVPIGGRMVPFAATYFAGNNRHRGFEHIARTVRRVLWAAPCAAAVTD